MQTPDYSIWNVKISVITPVHIGNGVDLLNEYDYTVHKGQTWRIDDSIFLDSQDIDDPQIIEKLSRTPPAQLLTEKDFSAGNKLFRYVVRGVPRSSASGAVIQEQIKDVDDRVYLPASSVKGALRTSLAWFAWQQKRLKPDITKLNQNRKWAGKEYEKEIFGADPNHDFLKAMLISDSKPVGNERLILINSSVINRRGLPAAPIECEAIRPDTVFELSMKLDWSLYIEWAKKNRFHLQGKELLCKLAGVVQEHMAQRIDDEVAWYKDIANLERIRNFYEQLKTMTQRLGKNQFFMQIGGGTGWDSKTFGSHLKADPAFMQRIIGEYRLSRGKSQTPGTFPGSRRSVLSITKSGSGAVVSTGAYPLGWVLVELETGKA